MSDADDYRGPQLRVEDADGVVHRTCGGFNEEELAHWVNTVIERGSRQKHWTWTRNEGFQSAYLRDNVILARRLPGDARITCILCASGMCT